MPLAPGARLGPYEIVGPLGAGGMGEVYRAKDTRLGRDVAIKILPAHLSTNAEVRERFEREARAISSLNHPHICTLYDIGREGDADYFVMELLEGESLAARLERGPLKLDEALKVATQLAEGLAAAHRQGIVHRDLKPGNVVLTKSGAKILDFGVAKLREEQVVEMATRTTPLTSAGSMVGTVQYMAPEQLEGKPVDHRADLFAFGALLYEMLTGKRAFPGTSQASVIAAILTSEPRPVSELVPASPASLDRVIQSCLVKEPDERWSAASDLARELKWIADGGTTSGTGARAVAAIPKKPRIAGWMLVAAAAAGVLATLGATALVHGRGGTARPVTVVASLELPDTLELDTFDRSIALSPDGTQLALVASDQKTSTPEIYLRAMSSLVPKALAGTDRASYPFWSPDGKSLGFFAEGKLKRVDLADGIVRALCDAPAGRGGAWSPLGFIVFAPSAVGGLFQVPEAGGAPQPYTTLKSKTDGQRLPRFLRGGRRILYYSYNQEGVDARGVYAFDPQKGSTKLVVKSEAEAVYVEPGYLVFAREENLWIQPFDPERCELHGDARPIATGIQYDKSRRFMNTDLVAGGALVYQLVRPVIRSRLGWMDRSGVESAIPGEPVALGDADITPDGRRAAATISGDHGEIRVAVIELDRGIVTPIGDPDEPAAGPRWAPDGQHLAYSALVADSFQLLIGSTRPGEAPRQLTSGGGFEQAAGGFTPDGRFLLFEQHSNVDKRGTLAVADLTSPAGTAAIRPFLPGESGVFQPALSPDGALAEFASNKNGRVELSVVSFPNAGAVAQVTTTGVAFGTFGWLGPRELWWADPTNHVWAATITVRGSEFEIGTARPLLGGKPVTADMNILRYVPATDRFLVARAPDLGAKSKLVVASDWRP